VNRRVTAAFEATVKTLNDAGKLANFKVDAGPENIGIDVNKDDPVGSIVGLFESRGDVVGAFAANAFVTPALGDAVTQIGKVGEICAFGFDLGPKQQEQIRSGALTGALGPAALPAGLLAGDAALPDHRPRRRGGRPRHQGAAGHQGDGRHGRQALRELSDAHPPSPRAGEGRGGGKEAGSRASSFPLPDPSPQGEGNSAHGRNR
jgi:hypothetical protein